MTAQTDAFISAMGAAVGWTSTQITAVQTAASTYFPTTPTDLASQITTFIANSGTRDNNYNNYFAGTATGGPYSNGTYPITLYGGSVVYLPCPAAIQATVTHGQDAKNDVGISIVGGYNVNEVLGMFTAATAQTFNPAGVTGYAITAATSPSSFLLKKQDGTTWGSITFTGHTVSASIPTPNLSAGDTLVIYAPSVLDTTLQNFSFTIPGV